MQAKHIEEQMHQALAVVNLPEDKNKKEKQRRKSSHNFDKGTALNGLDKREDDSAEEEGDESEETLREVSIKSSEWIAESQYVKSNDSNTVSEVH